MVRKELKIALSFTICKKFVTLWYFEIFKSCNIFANTTNMGYLQMSSSQLEVSVLKLKIILFKVFRLLLVCVYKYGCFSLLSQTG